MNFDKLFSQFHSLKVAVIGDVMLDTYWWGNVERVSPEAPVPIVALNKREQRIGGAGNVALNIASLGAQTTLFSVAGNDSDADTLISLLQEQKIDTKYIIKSRERITTNKIRIMGRNQQMMRLDAEIINDIGDEDEQTLIKHFESFINQEAPGVVILEDYNKGVLKESLIKKIIALCKEKNIVTTVDPKRKNFFSYKNVDIFKPNLKEVKEALNMLSEDSDETNLKNIHLRLNEILQHTISLITLSEHGIFFQHDNLSKIIPTHIRNIADVSGAGDTVIAVASLVYAVEKNILLAAEIANIAGGLVCEQVGTAAINAHKLLEECKHLIDQSL